MQTNRSPITTHVLDISLGRAAAGIPVTLEHQKKSGEWEVLKKAATNADGRVEDLMEKGARADAGFYRLTFHLHAYFEPRGVESFYPYASVVFEITRPTEHHHVPLLLSPFGFSTYRGT